MHIHYGLGKDNPVSRMRFFPKFASSECIGREVPESTYATLLPRFFEDKRIRVFCRSQDKVRAARKAFESWCRKVQTQSPFPSAAGDGMGGGGGGGDGDMEMFGEFEDEKGWTQFSQEEY